jgi:hypothetical protein
MRSWIARHRVLLIGALLVVALLGFGYVAPMAPRWSPVTSLLVTRDGAFPQISITPFAGSSTDAAGVQRFYNAIWALPHAQPGQYACPIEYGVRYQLTFQRGADIVLRAVASPGGCGGVDLERAGPFFRDDGRMIAAESFWAQLAETLGVPESQVYPVRVPVPKEDGPGRLATPTTTPTSDP